jgi:hypothetical protein
MKHFRYLILIFIFLGCQTKDCKEWYSGFRLTPVSYYNTGNEKIGDYYKTDFFDKELNFNVMHFYAADGYEECKTKIMIHEIINDSTFICCGNYLVIGTDTVKAFKNLSKYFQLSETKGSRLFKYNGQDYDFPIFERSENTFYVEFLLSDNKVLKDSCVVKIIQ